MSYTRPAATAVDLSWVGQPAYTRPAAATTDLSFLQGYQVTGFKATSFGTPTMLPQVAGFMPVHFGTPRTTTMPVSGFAPVALGTPVVRRSQPVAGSAPVHFGSIKLLPHAVGFRPVTFGAIHLLPHAAGWKAVHFGTITRRSVNRVTGFRPCHFGRPTTPTHRTVAARGLHTIKLGHPVAIKYTPRVP